MPQGTFLLQDPVHNFPLVFCYPGPFCSPWPWHYRFSIFWVIFTVLNIGQYLAGCSSIGTIRLRFRRKSQGIWRSKSQVRVPLPWHVRVQRRAFCCAVVPPLVIRFQLAWVRLAFHLVHHWMCPLPSGSSSALSTTGLESTVFWGFVVPSIMES